MNAFNRLAVMALAVAVIVGSAGICAVLVNVVTPTDLVADNWFRDQLVRLDDLSGGSKAAALSASVAGLAVASAILVAELATLWQRERLFVADAGGTEFRMDSGSIQRLVESAATDVAGVKAAAARLRDSQLGLQIQCNITVDPSMSIAELSPELDQKIKAMVVQMTGLPVAEIRLKLGYALPPPTRRRVS